MTDTQRYHDHRRFMQVCAERLPEFILKQVMMMMDRKELHLCLGQSQELAPMAEICLWTNLKLKSIHRIRCMMRRFPDPHVFAQFIENLEIPAFLDAPSVNYINAIGRTAHRLRFIWYHDTENAGDPDLQYRPTFEGNHITTLTWGGCSRNGRNSLGRTVPLSVLETYPHLTTLNWCIVDRRIGTVQSVLTKLDQRYPNLKSLQVPWTDHLDRSRWDFGRLPQFQHLKKIIFRFDHDSTINLAAFQHCLREFHDRGIPVGVGSGCTRETAMWLTQLYTGMWTYEFNDGRDHIATLHWLIQNNQTHVLRFTDVPGNSPMFDAMCEAVSRVRRTSEWGLRIQIPLTLKGIPDILLQEKICHLRLVITLQNIPGQWIPDIIRGNPSLRGLIIVIHEVQNESGYHGNCTFNPVPPIPAQDVRRNNQQYTTPTQPYQLVFRVDRKTAQLQKYWKYLSRSRVKPQAAQTLNTLDMGWPLYQWDDEAIQRYIAWENEITGWLDLCGELDNITVVLNKDPQMFGRCQEYWFTDRESLL
jgi:hypothetical protein